MSIIGRYACFPHGWPGHWDSCQHRRQRRSMNFGSGQAVVFLLHCRVAAPAAGPAGVPAAAEGVCIGSVSDRRDLSHPVRRRGTCTPDGACAWILTTPSGCRVGVAGRYVDRDGQTVLQQVQGLNLRIARAVPVQLPDELLVQLKKHFIGMLLVGEPDSGKTTLLRQIARELAGMQRRAAWWTSAARSFRRVIPRRCRRWICCPASLRNGLCRWHCARFRRRLFCWTSWARLPKLQRWNRAFTAG